VNDYIWIWDILRREGRRVINKTAEGFPIWSRDGGRLSGRSASRAGVQTAFVHDVQASGVVSEGRTFENVGGRVASWSPQGDVVAVGLTAPRNHIEFVSPGKQLNIAGFDAVFADFSPDGRWVVYQSSQTGTAEISIRSYPEGKVVGQVSTGGGVEPRWKQSGELFYRNGRRWFSTRVSTDSQLHWDPPHLAFESDFIDTPGMSYDVSRDGTRLLIVRRAQPVSRSKINLIVNWSEVFAPGK
jgi:dipeptidyl aminopeptidase/acylaminoacyl peptidase